MHRRAISLCLLAALVCAMLGGPAPCIGAADEETYVISISSATSNLSLSEDDLMLNMLRDRFNVEFDLLTINSAAPSDVYRLLAALNSLPDILLYNARWDQDYLIQCGALSPLPENMSQYPNLSRLIAYP